MYQREVECGEGVVLKLGKAASSQRDEVSWWIFSTAIVSLVTVLPSRYVSFSVAIYGSRHCPSQIFVEPGTCMRSGLG
jgi:hypothetical protein